MYRPVSNLFRLLPGLLCFFLVTAVASAQLGLEADAVRTSSPPTIDGDVDAMWDQAAWNEITWLVPDPWPTPSAPFAAEWKALWDDQNFYLLIDVVDDILGTFTSGAGAWQDDSIELFFDLGNDGGLYNSLTSQVYFRSEFDGEFYNGANPRGAQVAELTRATTVTDDGYRVEVAIPWSNWGASIADIGAIGFDIHVNDGEEIVDSRPARLVWNNTNNDNHSAADYFGTVNLVDEPAGPSVYIPGADVLEGDWEFVAPFGSYNRQFAPWIFHPEHNFLWFGLIEEPDASTDAFFFWHADLASWIYTGLTGGFPVYPEIYVLTVGTWGRYEFVDGERRFVRYDNGEVVVF